MPMKLCLFDLDHTLLPIDSDHAWGDFVVRIGWADAQEHRAGNDHYYRQYQAGTLDIHEYIDFATRPWRGRPAAEQDAAHARFMSERIASAIRPEALALIDAHRAAGDRLAIVTATNAFVTAPIARAFGIDALIAIDLERDAAGRYTGRIQGTPSFREGKVERVHQWLAADGLKLRDFDAVSVYSDSPNDLPLMEIATAPVATNPSPALAAVAQQRGWRTLKLFETP